MSRERRVELKRVKRVKRESERELKKMRFIGR